MRAYLWELCRELKVILIVRMQEASMSDKIVLLDIKLSVSRFREFIQLVQLE